MPKARILIIDTSPETRRMYGDYFRHHGYRVVEAASGDEAVRLSAAEPPELVVTELSREASWVVAIRSLRSPAPGVQTPVIACSTRIDWRRPYAPRWLDVDVALPKPTSPARLLRIAERLLARPIAA
jgi:DNA-binding response OmpR family regulator